MHDLKRYWLLFVSLLSGIVLMGLTVKADDYDITKYQVNVAVQKDGDAEVTQRINYDFDGDFHGVYYNQDLAGIGGVIGQPSVSAQPEGQKLTKLKATDTEDDQTFTVNTSAKQMKLKVFYPISDQKATFVYRYRLKGVVTNYLDTAELNWKIIGTGWDVSLNNVKITVQLPSKNIGQLQAWTHGPLSGQTKVDRKNGRITMAVKENPKNSFIESHLLFPTSVTSTNPNVVNQRVKKAKQRQEAKLAAAANRKRQRQTLIAYTGAWTAIVIGVGVWLRTIFWLRKHPAEKYPAVAPINHSYDVPAVPAAVAQSILTDQEPDQKAFSATLMEMAASKQISIQEVQVNKKSTYELTVLDPALLKQPLIMRRLFHTIGDEQKVTLKQVKDYGDTSGGKDLVAAFDDWKATTRQAAEDTNYQSTTNILLRQRLNISALVGTVAGLVAIPCLFLTGHGVISFSGLVVLLLILGGAGYCYWRKRELSMYSQSGAQLVAELKGFRRMLADIGHFDMAQVGDLILWEQILPYAVAFGYAKRVVKALRANFSEAELVAGMGPYYLMYFGYSGTDFTNSFSSDFGGGITAGTPSSSGGDSGGFSGGSSGGFGGGSGGGAF